MREPTEYPRGVLIFTTACTALALVLLAGSVFAIAPHSEQAAGYATMTGFLVLAAGAMAARFRIAAFLALVFAVYGGLSAVVAVSEVSAASQQFPLAVEAVRKLGVVSSLGHSPGPGPDSYHYALLVTTLGGVIATAAACVFRELARRPGQSSSSADIRLVERAGRALVTLGLLGVAAAFVRFLVIDHTGESLWQNLKSLWNGGSYALLVANFAVAGFGLWMHGLLSRPANRAELMWFAFTLLFFGGISLTSGQRGFLIQLILVCMVVLAWHYPIGKRQLAALLVAGIVSLGVTQAVRISISGAGSIDPGSVANQLKPRRWSGLLGDQLASFEWTWDVSYYRSSLHIPNTFVGTLAKPVPRQVYPGKSQGFADEFTRKLYPQAHADEISFATPLVAESDFSFGLAGVLVVLALVGGLAGLAEVRVVLGGPAEIRPVLAAGLIWICFVLIRGDLANALFVSAGWLLPLALVCAAIGFMPSRGSAITGRLLQPSRTALLAVDRRAAHTANLVGAQVERVLPDLHRRPIMRWNSAWTTLTAMMVTSSVLILYLGRGLTFFRDEWTFLIYRDGHDATNFLSSYAGHLLLWPTGFFLFLFKAVGLDHYELYRLAALPLHLGCALMVYLLARRRLGDWLALAPAGILLFLGSAWMDLLWPFQIAFTGAISFGLAALYLLDRDDLAGDAIACFLLLVAIGWSGAAIPFLAGVGAGLTVRRRLLARSWVVLVPGLFYLLWQSRYGGQQVATGDLLQVPGFALDMAGAGITGITGLPLSSGVYLAVPLGILAVGRAVQLGRSSPLVWEALAAGLAFWILTAVARVQEHDPGASRYIYSSVVFILLLIAGLAKATTSPQRAVIAIVLIVTALMLPTGIVKLVHGSEDFRFTSNVTSAELGALELARGVVDADYSPELNNFPAVPSAAFFAATDRYASSPADSPDEIADSPEYARRRADRTLVEALGVQIRPTSGRTPLSSQPPEIGAHPRTHTEVSKGCTTLSGNLPHADFELPAEGILIKTPPASGARVGLRRFADQFPRGTLRLRPGADGTLKPHADADQARPWHARISVKTGPVTVCGLSAPFRERP